MDGFFGIGFGELVLIAIVALIVLGPERLPSALREVAKFIRMLRNLSQEFTDQFGDEFKALEDLNPRRLLQDAIEDIDDEEKAKDESTKPAGKKNTTATSKSTAAKSTTKPPAKATAAKNTTAKSPATAKSSTTDSTASSSTSSSTEIKSGDTEATASVEEPVAAEKDINTTATASTATEPNSDVVVEDMPDEDNRIAPPECTTEPTATKDGTATNKEPSTASAAEKIAPTNGHVSPTITTTNHTGNETIESIESIDELPNTEAGSTADNSSVTVDESVTIDSEANEGASDLVQDEEKQP